MKPIYLYAAVMASRNSNQSMHEPESSLRNLFCSGTTGQFSLQRIQGRMAK